MTFKIPSRAYLSRYQPLLGMALFLIMSASYAQVSVNNKTINLGGFINIKDAVERRKIADKEYGFTKTHGVNA